MISSQHVRTSSLDTELSRSLKSICNVSRQVRWQLLRALMKLWFWRKQKLSHLLTQLRKLFLLPTPFIDRRDGPEEEQQGEKYIPIHLNRNGIEKESLACHMKNALVNRALGIFTKNLFKC